MIAARDSGFDMDKNPNPNLWFGYDHVYSADYELLSTLITSGFLM